MSRFAVVMLIVSAAGSVAQAQSRPQSVQEQSAANAAVRIETAKLDPAVTQQQARLQKLIVPKVRERILQLSPGLSAKLRQLPPSADFHSAAVAEVRGSYPGAANLPPADIESLVFLVMMQATSDSESDLQKMLDELKKESEHKQVLRNQQAKKDAMNDLSEANSLRLQMLMDRRSKLLQTMSNMAKKMQDTDDAIIKNLK